MKKRKKYMGVISIVSIMLCLSSCRGIGNFIAEKMDSSLIAERHLDLIIQALETNNRDEIKNIFSVNALKEAENFDDGMDYIMSFYKGSVISTEVFQETIASTENGESDEKIYSYYTVTTDISSYVIGFTDQITDTKNPDNVGLYNLIIINEKEDEEFNWDEATEISGIYQPSVEAENCERGKR